MRMRKAQAAPSLSFSVVGFPFAVSLVFDLASHDDGGCPAAHFPARERAIAALGAKPIRVDRPLGIWIDDCHVSLGSGAQGAAIDAEHPRRVDGKLLDELRPDEMPRLDQRARADRNQ